jgi:protein-L-isoaspartate(D-aspartate) O-methyltransferase
MSDTTAARRAYTEYIRNREQIASPRLLRALSIVPREHFLGKGPWRVKSEMMDDYRKTESSDPIHLYQDVLVAIDEGQKLDSGLPSLWAHLYDLLKIKKNERVVQVGCGVGYYSAILSKVVGVQGRVLAIDCDSRLVRRARANLREYGNVDVIHGDGFRDVGGQADVIIVHAGCTHPHPLWIRSLRNAGRLLVPLTKPSWQGTIMKITRLGHQYRAEAVRRIEIFPCRGRENTLLHERLTDWWETASALAPLRFRSIKHGLPSNDAPNAVSSRLHDEEVDC